MMEIAAASAASAVAAADSDAESGVDEHLGPCPPQGALDVDTCEAFDASDNLDMRSDVGVFRLVKRSHQQSGCRKKGQMELALWSFGGDDTASTPAPPAVDHSLLDFAAGDVSFDSSPFDANMNVSMHAEGQHFFQPPGSGTGNHRFHDEDIQRAAGVALEEGQDGSGYLLVNADGSINNIRDTTHRW